MRALFDLTIWAKGAIPADEWKYRNLKRVMFPIVYVLFLFSGVYAAESGVPAISGVFSDSIIDTVSCVLSLSAILCLFGISFPKLWPVEITGASLILGIMTGYLLALFFIGVWGSGDRGFVWFVSCVSITPIIWRLSLLGFEWQFRRLDTRGE